MALSKPESVPFLEDSAPAHFAQFIRRKGADTGIELKESCAFLYQVGRYDAVAINDGYDIVFTWSATRNRSKAITGALHPRIASAL